MRLGREARSDIEWWWRFCKDWNGVAVLLGPPEARATETVATDASGSWGCGACWTECWFQLQWHAGMLESHITCKELVPIVVATAVWGAQWQNMTVQVLCDNEAVVAIVNKGTAKDQECMHLVRCLAFLKAELVATHIQGKLNTQADALSRNGLTKFRTLHPQADREPAGIPASLLDLLLVQRPDWRWAELWSSTFRMA